MSNVSTDEMRKVAEVCKAMQYTSVDSGLYGEIEVLLDEAAKELDELRLKLKSYSNGVFLSGSNVTEQIKSINRDRAEHGLPPL